MAAELESLMGHGAGHCLQTIIHRNKLGGGYGPVGRGQPVVCHHLSFSQPARQGLILSGVLAEVGRCLPEKVIINLGLEGCLGVHLVVMERKNIPTR